MIRNINGNYMETVKTEENNLRIEYDGFFLAKFAACIPEAVQCYIVIHISFAMSSSKFQTQNGIILCCNNQYVVIPSANKQQIKNCRRQSKVVKIQA